MISMICPLDPTNDQLLDNLGGLTTIESVASTVLVVLAMISPSAMKGFE